MNCWTSYAERIILGPLQSNILVGFFIALSSLAIISNTLLIWALVRTEALFQNKRCRMNWILFTISISDLITGTVTIPLILVLFTQYQFDRFCELEKATVFTGIMMNHFTAYNIFFLGLEQYLRLDPRMGAKKIQVADWLNTNQGLLFMVFTSFILSVIHAILSSSNFESRTIPDSINGILNFGLYIACVAFYIIMYVKVRNSSAKTNSVLHREGTSKKIIIPVYLRKLTRLVYILLFASCVCYLPFLLIELAFAYRKFIQHKPITQVLRFANFLTWLPVLFFASLNAVLTLYFRRNLRLLISANLFGFKNERAQGKESVSSTISSVEIYLVDDKRTDNRKRVEPRGRIATITSVPETSIDKKRM